MILETYGLLITMIWYSPWTYNPNGRFSQPLPNVNQKISAACLDQKVVAPEGVLKQFEVLAFIQVLWDGAEWIIRVPMDLHMLKMLRDIWGQFDQIIGKPSGNSHCEFILGICTEGPAICWGQHHLIFMFFLHLLLFLLRHPSSSSSSSSSSSPSK